MIGSIRFRSLLRTHHNKLSDMLLFHTTSSMSSDPRVTIVRSVNTMALSNFSKVLQTPFVGAFQMISDPIGQVSLGKYSSS